MISPKPTAWRVRGSYMPNNNDRIIRKSKQWYVMLHLKPELAEYHLQEENEQRRRKRLRQFEYFVPYQFLPKAVPDQYAKDLEEQKKSAADVNDLRNNLHHFVFIKATANEMARLVSQPWNRDERLHMHYYCSYSGRRITMPDTMMESFITLCCDKRQCFSFGPPVTNIEDYDTVVIAHGNFKNIEAKVIDVQHTSHGISVTLGIPFFNGEKTLQLPGFKPADLHLPHTVGALLNDHFIDNVERELTAILNRRVKRPWDTSGAKEDTATLNHLFHYSYVRMPDNPSHCRFRALMLICAALRTDSDSRHAITAEVMELLSGQTEAASKEQAYLMLALYVATADADYRTAAKHYQQQHAETDLMLNRIMSPVKRMNKDFFKSLKIS